MSTRERQKDESRTRILASAARLLRERGFSGVGVAEIMSDAGLTHGGFYAHFGSKADLLGQALGRAAQTSRGRYFTGLRGKQGAAWIEAAVRRYLSPVHRDDPGDGCPFAALGNDASRSEPSVRAVMEEELRQSARSFEQHLREAGVKNASGRSLALLSLCAGGLSLARAVDDPKLSEQILSACKDFAAAALVPGTRAGR